MRVIFLLYDHLLSQYSNQVSESLTLIDQILWDVMELDMIIHSMVQDLGQDLVQVVVVLILIVEVVVTGAYLDAEVLVTGTARKDVSLYHRLSMNRGSPLHLSLSLRLLYGD